MSPWRKFKRAQLVSLTTYESARSFSIFWPCLRNRVSICSSIITLKQTREKFLENELNDRRLQLEGGRGNEGCEKKKKEILMVTSRLLLELAQLFKGLKLWELVQH